jgi:hypothetical protein
MIFYLGTNDPFWLWDNPPTHPLFISHRRLARYKKLKPAQNPWALDSGGFTELSMFGEWRTGPTEYIHAIRRYINEIGNLQWASPQDWMCEPTMLQKTGLTVTDHHHLTINNFLELRHQAPDLPIIPALQGWTTDDYHRHIDLYAKAGIDLFKEPLVGMGSFCRRASFNHLQAMVHQLADNGLKMHGYGVKSDGLPVFGEKMVSTDSMAWSLTARRAKTRLCGQPHNAQKCANCRTWATTWANNVITKIGNQPVQMELTPT